jgi:hypothetical protein
MEIDDTQDFDLDLEDEPTEQPEKDWKAEALKFKSIAQRYKQKATAKVEAKADTKEIINNDPTPKSHPLDDEYGELRFRGFDKDTAQFVVNNGGLKALDDANSLVSIAVKAKKEQAEAELKASQTSTEGGSGDPIFRKHSEEELRNMSATELEKILPKA